MEERRRELSERLGRVSRTGAGRELKALAHALADEQIAAVVIGVWRRRAWVLAATERGLRLSRRPRLFGRKRDISWSWSELRQVRAGQQRLDLVFGEETVELSALVPHTEFVRLVDGARRAVSDSPPETETVDLRELAKSKLGRTGAFGWEGSIDSLPDRLLDDERVERIAIARLDFEGLLVVTDRRVILFNVGLRRANERLWEVDREQILGAEAVDDSLRLHLPSGAVALTDVLPHERCAELAAALWRG
jgi:hypothetical protein